MLRLVIHMSVCICCGRILCIPQLFLHRFHIEAETQKHSRAAVTQVMKSDIRQIVLTKDFFKGLSHIIRSMKFPRIVHTNKSFEVPVVMIPQVFLPVLLFRLQILKILSEGFRKDEISYTFFVFIFSLMKIVSFPVSSLAGVTFI